MENFEKDMKQQVLDLLTGEAQGQGQGSNEEEIDGQNATQVKENESEMSSSGKVLSSSTIATGKNPEVELGLCPVCQTNADKTCGACKSVSYCSVEHQKAHWKTHKNLCPPFIIKETETNGKEWIATRDLPADTILLQELPVLSCPKWDDFDAPYCVACGIAMINTENKDRKCSKCSWPICSENCEKNSLHAENECEFFSTHKMEYSFPGSVSSFAWNGFQILLIRASNLKLKNKELFDKIMELQDFRDISHVNDELKNKSELLLTIYGEFLGDLTVEECKKLLRICLINIFHHNDDDKIGHVILLYLQSSRLNHSCSPNCFFSVGTPPDFKMRVRTAVPVKKGESLRIFYHDAIKLQPTFIRQQYLQHVLGFKCECERCVDPTELGAFITGIKCQKCQLQKSKNKKCGDAENLGYFLVENPLDLSLDSQSGSVTSDLVYKCNACGEKKLFSLLKSSLPVEIQQAFDTNGNIENPKGFLAKYETGGNYLHKNHYLIHTLVEKIIYRANKMVMTLKKLELKRNVRRLEYLLEIHNLLFPGLFERKAILLVHLMLSVCHILGGFSHQLSSTEIGKLVSTGQMCYKMGMEHFKKGNSFDSPFMPEALERGMNLLKMKYISWMDPSI